MSEMFIGAIATCCIVIGLFFLRFWKSTHDVFFLFFALSFFLEGANRVSLVLFPSLHEASPSYYVIRVISYSFIIVAILAKNKRRKAKKPES
ncbi:DUF5985 family protein [Cellvibrio mixtus]|uniref:DUF5985 family protein n=1 Tax=Cellvibrio mixtus TaxID=39650 RepID=UPI0005874509|nr:DUF5985 family protein [Cellvibrio mixtus]